jgi:hypothetical protein
MDGNGFEAFCDIFQLNSMPSIQSFQLITNIVGIDVFDPICKDDQTFKAIEFGRLIRICF